MRVLGFFAGSLILAAALPLWVRPVEVGARGVSARALPGTSRQAGSSAAAGPETLRQTFRRAVEARERGDSLAAGLLLEGLEGRYPVMGDYILYERMLAVRGKGDPEAALELARRIFREYPESLLTARVRMEMVRSFLDLHQFAEARSVARGLLQEQVDPEMQRGLSLLVGASYEGQGDWKGALEVYQRLAYEAPATPEGEEADRSMERISKATGLQPEVPGSELYLACLRALDRSFAFDRVIEVSEAFARDHAGDPALEQARLLRARALFKSGRPEEGRKIYAALTDAARSPSVRFEAAYRLGSDLWNRHENGRARKVFKRLIRKDPRGEWGLKARYALGRIYEEETELSQARDAYLKIGEVRRGDPLSAEGAWRAGWVEYKAGRYRKASRLLGRCMERYPDSPFFEAALYWKGRSDAAAGREGEAEEHFLRLARDFEWDFYGIMARRRLGSRAPAAHPPAEETRGAAPAAGGEKASRHLFAYHLDRAEELVRLGFRDWARREILALEEAGPRTPEVAERISDLYERSGNFYDLVRWAAWRSGEVLRPAPGSDASPYMRHLYPLAFWEEVQAAAAKEGVDPFLVLAVMRQESLFQQDVVSGADARGLMQIIPSTGERLARQVGVPGYTPDLLLDPETNIALGAWYLRELLDRSDGDLVRALSGYNAGESRSDRWWNRHKHLDLDERIESITFRETKGYVKKVLRNLENYRRLYGALALPEVNVTGAAGTGE